MSPAAKVGAFFLVVLILTALLIWKIEDLRFGKKLGTEISVQFENTGGLKEKAEVRMAGVLVGRVDRIRLVGGKALVDIELSRDVELRQGASATLQSLGMLGEKYVELVPGPVGAASLPPGAILQGEQPVNFDQITRLAKDIEVDIKDITRNLKDSLGGALGEERLTGIVQNVLALSRELRRLVEANRTNIDATTSNFREFSGEVTRLVERIDRLVASNQANVTASISNTKDLTAKLQTTVDNINAITGRIRSGEGTVGQLVESEQTSKNLNEALVAVKDGVKDLTAAMEKVKKWDVDLGLRAEYLSRYSKAQSFFTLDVIPRDKPRFYRLELSNEPLGVRHDTTTVTTTTFPDGHKETVRQDEVSYKDSVAVSAEVGFRLQNFIGRAGLIENTGGFGIDYLGLRNRLMLSAQFWNFGRPDLNAQAKLTGRYYFSPSVFVTGGWNDFLNTKAGLDSAFVGAGIRWGDEDAKYLAGSVPIH
jgi:phospholipid/cholesterol/gamma-HCH transport system substrate-binding protein